MLRVRAVDHAPLLLDPRRVALLELRELLPEPRVRLLEARAPATNEPNKLYTSISTVLCTRRCTVYYIYPKYMPGL